MHRTCQDRVLQTKFPLKKLTGSSILLNFKKLSPGHSLSWQNSIHVGRPIETKLMKTKVSMTIFSAIEVVSEIANVPVEFHCLTATGLEQPVV